MSVNQPDTGESDSRIAVQFNVEGSEVKNKSQASTRGILLAGATARTFYGLLVALALLGVNGTSVSAQNCTPTAITAGTPVNGSLTDSDCEAPHWAGRKADLYTFAGTAGQQVTIAMNRSTLDDPYLISVGPSGSVVNDPRADDDRGGQ